MSTILSPAEFIQLAKAEPETLFLGVIGFPISQSKSPFLHNLAYSKFNIRAKYFAVEIQTESEFIDFINETEKIENCKGFNVTIPYKNILFQTIPNHKYLDLGAANTIQKVNGKWKSENTDWLGFLSPISGLTFNSALILGSGGATGSVIYGLQKLNHKIDITNISRRMVEKKGIKFIQSDYSVLTEPISETDIIINTTPLGMTSFQQNFSDDFLNSLPKTKLAYDLIYNPLETKFLSHFKKQNSSMINGMEMFIEQASNAYNLWFGSLFTSEIKSEFIREITK